MYTETTRDIRITVTPTYLAAQSEPAQSRYFWAYSITIENQGVETVQLRTRHWRITDAHGRMVEVKGDGVVGEEPVLAPGGRFEYTSGTPLDTSSGIMVGTYGMVTKSGDWFDAKVPAFSLDSPYSTPAQLN